VTRSQREHFCVSLQQVVHGVLRSKSMSVKMIENWVEAVR